MIDWIDAAHRSFASLFFDYVCDKSGRARNHEYAVERCGIHSQVGEDGADRAVHIDRERFFRVGKCFLSRSRRMHIKRRTREFLSGVPALMVPNNATAYGRGGGVGRGLGVGVGLGAAVGVAVAVAVAVGVLSQRTQEPMKKRSGRSTDSKTRAQGAARTLGVPQPLLLTKRVQRDESPSEPNSPFFLQRTLPLPTPPVATPRSHGTRRHASLAGLIARVREGKKVTARHAAA